MPNLSYAKFFQVPKMIKNKFKSYTYYIIKINRLNRKLTLISSKKEIE